MIGQDERYRYAQYSSTWSKVTGIRPLESMNVWQKFQIMSNVAKFPLQVFKRYCSFEAWKAQVIAHIDIVIPRSLADVAGNKAYLWEQL